MRASLVRQLTPSTPAVTVDEACSDAIGRLAVEIVAMELAPSRARSVDQPVTATCTGVRACWSMVAAVAGERFAPRK